MKPCGSGGLRWAAEYAAKNYSARIFKIGHVCHTLYFSDSDIHKKLSMLLLATCFRCDRRQAAEKQAAEQRLQALDPGPETFVWGEMVKDICLQVRFQAI